MQLGQYDFHWWVGMEIRVCIKFTFDTCNCGKVQQNLAENLNIIWYLF